VECGGKKGMCMFELLWGAGAVCLHECCR